MTGAAEFRLKAAGLANVVREAGPQREMIQMSDPNPHNDPDPMAEAIDAVEGMRRLEAEFMQNGKSLGVLSLAFIHRGAIMLVNQVGWERAALILGAAANAAQCGKHLLPDPAALERASVRP